METRPKRADNDLTVARRRVKMKQEVYIDGRIVVDEDTLDGYWEYKDGTEGGALTFDLEGDRLVLADYDGAYCLPRYVCRTLESMGVRVDEEFWPDQK